MRTVKINEINSVVLYSTAKEMTISRYSSFQRFLLLDAGVGSTIEDVSTHFAKLHSFLAQRMVEEAIKEAENLHFNFWSVLESIDFESLAFACMVHSVNGEIITDISEDNLKVVTLMLSDIGLTKQLVESEVDDIKKKINDEIALFFPDKNNDGDSFQFYADLQRKVLLIEQIISGNPNVDEIQRAIDSIERSFAELSRPKSFKPGDPENAVLSIETDFEYLCSLLEMNGVSAPKNLSIIEFYSRLEYFKKTHSKNPKV